MLERARRNRWNAEARAAGENGKEPHDWTPEEAHQVELMQRYLTTAERSFYRAWNAVQGLRKDIVKDRREARNLEAKLEQANARLRQLGGESASGAGARRAAQETGQAADSGSTSRWSRARWW